MEVIVVISNFPDRASALAAAEKLVESRAAACVNVLAECRSVYRWKGAVESAAEVPLLAKTLRENFSLVQQVIRAHHPYELPEIVAVPVCEGLPAYLQWVADETAGASA